MAWRSFVAVGDSFTEGMDDRDPSGNGFEVNFVPDFKILHGAGYNVLAYDLRNHGLSAAANGGIGSSGIFEARDVVGSLQYARDRTDSESRNADDGDRRDPLLMRPQDAPCRG